MLVNPKDVIDRGLARLPARMDSRAARVLMYAIGRQESRFTARDQLERGGRDILPGPAMGVWQFERGGGVRGVLTHVLTRDLARQACAHFGVDTAPRAAWLALETNDELAAIFARLLLYPDPARLPLPLPAYEQDAWSYYVRNWRPGKPHRDTWGRFWREACAAYEVEGANA